MGVCALMALVKGMFTDIIRSQLMSNMSKLTAIRLETFKTDSANDIEFKQLIHDIEAELRIKNYLIEELTELLEDAVKDIVGFQVKIIKLEGKELMIAMFR